MIDTPVSVVVRTQCSIRTDVSRFKWKALVGTYHDHESFTIFKSRRFTFRMILKKNIRIILFFFYFDGDFEKVYSVSDTWLYVGVIRFLGEDVGLSANCGWRSDRKAKDSFSHT